MRQDAKDLLARLNRRDFNYRQFADPFADMELWPIFEALLTDSRVVAGRPTGLDVPEVRIRNRGAEAAPEAAAPATPAALFSHYARKAEPGPARGGEVVNMRRFLSGLADKR
ncbi:MAG: hypothetical protein ABW203_07760 [Novosphingobium sp.]